MGDPLPTGLGSRGSSTSVQATRDAFSLSHGQHSSTFFKGNNRRSSHIEPTEEERGDSHTVLDNPYHQLISRDTTISQDCDHQTSKNRGLQVLWRTKLRPESIQVIDRDLSHSSRP